MLLWLACNGGEVAPTDLDKPDDTEVVVDSPVDSEDTSNDDTEDTSPPVDTDPEFEGPPRIVLFIGDGMGFDHVAGGGLLANGSAGSLRMEGMERQGRLRTASLSGLTDSAASATAYSSGVKTWNGRLGKDGDGNDVQNILELAREQGMATGIVTSDDVTGGTPGAFMAHVNSRGDKPGIIEDMMAAKPDILLGGGWRTLELPLADEGDTVQVLRTRDELLNLVPEDKPIFGVFTDDTLPFVSDDTGDDPPTLAEMATVALQHIQADPEGYILIVEGARIDHASHGRMGDRVLQEVVDFDNAVAAVLDAVGDEEVTVMVTADHECGGLALTGETVDGLPEVTWRRNDHTNEDVPIYAQGPRTARLHEARWDNRIVHSVMKAVILDQPLVEPPEVAVIDGWLDDVGSRVTEQVHHSDFGHGHNQMDALRLSSDGQGIRVGVDGIFEDRNNIPLVLVDLDFGDGTGLGSSNDLGDEDGTFDTALSALSLDIQVAGLGFDVAIGGFEAQDLRFDSLHDGWGLRGVNTPWMEPGNLFWLKGVLNFDDGNIARDHETARDMGDPGFVEHGWEMLIPWNTLYGGMPPEALDIAVFATTVDRLGTTRSNQALPAYPSWGIQGDTPIPVEKVVRMFIATDGTHSTPSVHP